MKIKNQTGSLKVDYKLRHKRYEAENFAALELWIALPGQKMEYLDSITQIRHNEYNDNLRACLIEAEEKWGLDLLELEINALA